MNEPLYMTQLRLPARLVFGEKEATDTGYRLHALLTGLFGEHAPKPFHGRVVGREVEVLGYAGQDAESLLATARLFATPELATALHGALHAKPMPAIPPGQRLGFQVNTIPTVRANGGVFHKGAEVDAWLHARLSRPDQEPPEREAVYLEWFRKRLESPGGPRLDGVELAGMRGVRLLRRNRQRALVATDQREAIFRGVLTVGDEAAFRALLRRGVGRHLAFGFGMMRLSPPGRLGVS